ncbi:MULTISPECIES: hypothetical protein [Sphingobium]|nr:MULTISPECIES: hypothetical protein [Sphingobium]WRD77990.1 hypothetical protein QQ987_07810 [Sphingobium baderi]
MAALAACDSVSAQNDSQKVVLAAYKAAGREDASAFAAIAGGASLTVHYFKTKRPLQISDFRPKNCKMTGMSGLQGSDHLVHTNWSCNSVQGYDLAVKTEGNHIVAAYMNGGDE